MNIRTTFAILASLAAFATQGASAASASGDASAFGQAAASPTAAGRVIDIKPDTRYVNVTNGETVQFKAGERSFTWQVSTYNNVNAFELARIAPSDVAADGVVVYVAPSPTYAN